MFQSSQSGADASTVSSAIASPNRTPESRSQPHTLRHMLFGSPAVVRNTIYLLYQLNYAEPNDWSKPVPTGKANEVVCVLTRKLKV